MAAKTYNRIERESRRLGEIIKRTGPPPLEQDYAVVEAILESRRPPKCLDESRGERWFCDERRAVAAGWRRAAR